MGGLVYRSGGVGTTGIPTSDSGPFNLSNWSLGKHIKKERCLNRDQKVQVGLQAATVVILCHDLHLRSHCYLYMSGIDSTWLQVSHRRTLILR